MSKDVKIELIYYKSNTDVSLEFGLHGDYPLRLLSVSTDNRTEFFHSLKRAVSRSEIIIIIGGYEKKEYLPLFLAKAIGKKTVVGDNGDFGILESGKIELPEGAIPLVSKGKFGGFIIESGPQTIFSLTNDRKTRLAVTKDIIVSYITEHHKTFGITSASIKVQSSIDTASYINEPEADQSAENTEFLPKSATNAPIPTEFTDISSTKHEHPSNEVTFSSFEEDSETTASKLEGKVELFEKAEPEPFADYENDIENESEAKVLELSENTSEKRKLNDGVQKSTVNPFLIDPDDVTIDTDKRKHKPHHQLSSIRILCIILSLLVILSSAAFVFVYRKNGFVSDYYSALFKLYDSHRNTPVLAFDKIKSKNNDFFTWLTLDTAGINYPVLSVKDTDASKKKLTTLPNGRSDPKGTIFSSTSTSPNIAKKNTVIYGNASPNGAFYGLNTTCQSAADLIGSTIKTADSGYQAEWIVFSAFDRSTASGFDYTRTDFSDTDDYIEYLNTLQGLGANEAEALFLGNEKLIILVGIDGDENYVAVGKLSSVRVLTASATADLNNYSSEATNEDGSTDVSSDNASRPDVTSSETESVTEVDEDDFHGDSPDIVLPLPTVSSTPSSTTSQSTSSNVSSSQSSPSLPSSSAPSEQTSSVAQASSDASSTVQPTPSVPNVDPTFTWDKEFTITDNATNIKYTATAVDMVAMIIEDEMSPTIDPAEAVIAQAIVKYNWLLHNNGNSNALDPNPTPQAKMYAESAKGSVIMYGNTIAKTFCYAYSAGKTANCQDIWGGTAYPYLQSVDCPVDEGLKDFITTTTYSAELIKSIIKAKCGIDVSDIKKEDWLKPLTYDTNGLYCLKISIGGEEYNGRYLRETLLTKANTGVAAIRSTAYTVTYDSVTDTFTVSCKGYGHGVGLSQRGAKAYAKMGWTHEQIIAHFFPGTTLVKH